MRKSSSRSKPWTHKRSKFSTKSINSSWTNKEKKKRRDKRRDKKKTIEEGEERRTLLQSAKHNRKLSKSWRMNFEENKKLMMRAEQLIRRIQRQPVNHQGLPWIFNKTLQTWLIAGTSMKSFSKEPRRASESSKMANSLQTNAVLAMNYRASPEFNGKESVTSLMRTSTISLSLVLRPTISSKANAVTATSSQRWQCLAISLPETSSFSSIP